MSMMSSVGSHNLYEDGDQRNDPQTDRPRERYHEGKENSHQANDFKDNRTLANRLDREERREQEEEEKSKEKKLNEIDPTLPARSHGNEPSKGAKIDAEIAEEEEEILKKKDAKK